MMTDPVQVVAEARKSHSAFALGLDDNYYCICRKVVIHKQPYDARNYTDLRAQKAFDAHVNEAIVAALTAAGALMPDEAEQLRSDLLFQRQVTRRLSDDYVRLAETGLSRQAQRIGND